MTNEEKLVKRLIDKSLHISYAESCTGGLLAARTVAIPNASYVLGASFVTYSEDAKQRFASVDPETIKRFGVVSEAVAREMAVGCAANAGSEIGVGVTGYAGPSGGDAENPVGTVCIGVSVRGNVTAFTRHFNGMTRSEVINAAADAVFAALCELTEDIL